ncbi:MAG: lysostaphin resistance A-like protein [Rhodanobacter sp.]
MLTLVPAEPTAKDCPLMEATHTAPPPLPATARVASLHLGSALGYVALYFVLQITIGTAIAIAVGFWLGLRNGLNHTSDDLTQQIVATLAQPDMQAAAVMLSVCGAAVPMLWLTRRKWRQLWRMPQAPGFGFVAPTRAWFYLAAIAVGLGSALIGGWLSEWLAHGQEISQDVKELGTNASPAVSVALALIVVTLGPLVEELLFRGVLLSALLRHLGTLWAVLVCSLLFALIHLPGLNFLWYAVPNLFLLALALAWLRLHSRSIWPSVLAHSTNNLLAVSAWFFAASLPG